jgi:hypothetical protein
VPVVRDKLFGARPRQEPDTAALAASAPGETEEKGPEPPRPTTGPTTRVMVKSRKEIEEELEKLSREYVGK